VVDEHAVAVRIAQDRLTPQVGLIRRRLLERQTVLFERRDEVVQAIALEVDAGRAPCPIDRTAIAVERQRAVAIGADEPCVVLIRHDLSQAEPFVERDRSLQIADAQGDVIRYPDVQLSLIEGEPRELITLVRAAELDLAVIYDYPTLSVPLDEHLEATHLLDDRFELVVPDDHPLARRRRLSLGALAHERWLFPRVTGGVSATYDRLVRGACAVAGFEPQILFEINDCQTAQGFVAAGLGIAVLPHLALHPVHRDVTVRTLADAPSRSVLAVRLRGSAPPPSARAALQLLRVAAQESAAGPRS
jgi:LysR substrate binding domain-containing protein